MIDPKTALRELRELVGTYLESSDYAPRAAELLDVLEARYKPVATASPTPNADRELDRERKMFGCTAAAIDEALEGKEPRDVAMYAMGTLSNAQEMIRRSDDGWTVYDRDADTIRRLMNVAKYAIDKAVPR